MTEPWHLPEFMRDFHVQKDVFRALASWDAKNRSDSERTRYPAPSWPDAHVYTVDVFLRFMAEHGYTLQRCRRALEFRDVSETLAQHAEERREASARVLSAIVSVKQ